MSVVALIDYGAGNLRSVHNALVAAGAEDVAVTADPKVVGQADRIVLPGVGAFAACMNGLSAIPRSEEHTSELQSLMRISYAVFCLKKKNYTTKKHQPPVLMSAAQQ